MVNKPKRQGTENETRIAAWLTEQGYRVTRLAEGGVHDAGDLLVEDEHGDYWIVECKHRERMNAHKTLAAAKAKAAHAADRERIPYPTGVILQWKRTTLKAGNVQRSAEGEPELFIVDGPTLLLLLGGVR